MMEFMKEKLRMEKPMVMEYVNMKVEIDMKVNGKII
jgi:hypothetical protein